MRASPIRLAITEHGEAAYLVATTPDALPPVRTADLEEAWSAAREAAGQEQWGAARTFRFRGEEQVLDLALTDPDACCWAHAVDQIANLTSLYGLSLCLRLLALVDLLARVPALRPFWRLGRAGATLHPALSRAAATACLTSHATFDERAFDVPLALLTAGANA